jgi:phospholipid/cholesterol/gamma-HCH transport system substrate-binding protein
MVAVMNDDTLHMRGRKALWFATIPVLITLVLLAIVAYKQRLFVASDRLYAFADSGAGIVGGMPVKVQGFTVGSVREMVLVAPEEGKAPQVRLTLEINRDTMRFIGKDATIRYVQEGLIGQTVLEIIHGDQRARRAASGDVLVFERGRTLSEMANDLSSKAKPVLDNVQELTRQLSDPNGNFAQTLQGARQAVIHTDETVQKIGVLSSQSAAMFDKLGSQATKALSTTDSILGKVENTVSKVDGVLDQAVEITQHVSAVAVRVHKVVDENGQTVDEAGRAAKSALRSWPLSLWAQQPSELGMPVDSQDQDKSFLVPAAHKSAP